MSTKAHEQAARDIVTVLPERADDVTRLLVLAADGEPTVTVIGKYNHGKSRLLNELIGHERFAVADRRETVALADSVEQGIRWLDAPGLDADVHAHDDRHAWQAAWLRADIRLFVHSAKEGELDALERTTLNELLGDHERTRRQTLVVLSQVDQLADDNAFDHVTHAIREQIPNVALHATSSTRHRKGVEENKALLLKLSGIPALHAALDDALTNVPVARGHERIVLAGDIRAALARACETHGNTLDALRAEQLTQRTAFDAALAAVVTKVSRDIEAFLATLGDDHASTPDTARDAYALTAGKLERNKLQNAYSRACIEIDSVLIAHGVSALPLEQQTAANSLNSVMVAVMGVSVKLRAQLRRIFCEASGRDRMEREFSRYYVRSSDRVAMVVRIERTEAALAQAQQAVKALHVFEAVDSGRDSRA